MQPTALVAYEKHSGSILLVHHYTSDTAARELEARREAVALGSVPDEDIDLISVPSSEFVPGNLYKVEPSTRELKAVAEGENGSGSAFGVSFSRRAL